MQQAMIAIEDHRFYEHGPLDAHGTLRAFLTNVAAGGVTQGGSTITQQYVKMVQIEEAKKAGDEAAIEAAQDGTYGRKIRELRYAISVEKTLSKDEILERYLNIAYFGDGAYGIEVAAQHYFGTTAAKLTLAAGRHCWPAWCRTRRPTTRWSNPTAALAAAQRRAQPDGRARTSITAAQAGQGDNAATSTRSRSTSTSNGCQGTDYPFLCDYVYRSLAQTAEPGRHGREARRRRSSAAV